MTHYVCPTCGNTSEAPAACSTNGCAMMGQDMLACNCEDNQHGEIMTKQSV